MRRTIMVLALVGCAPAPAIGEMMCDAGYVDVWQVDTKGRGPIGLSVDTVDSSTSFDPYLEVASVTSWSEDPASIEIGEILASGDDDFPCSAAAADERCPHVTVPNADEPLLAIVGINGSCAGPDAEFELSVRREGKSREVIHLGFVAYDDIQWPDDSENVSD